MANSLCAGVTALVLAGSEAGRITLPIPDPIVRLPKLASTRHTVHAPAGWDDLTYHHRPIIAVWRGKLYVAWHAAARSERTPPVLAMVARSDDGSTWSPPVNIAAKGDARYMKYTSDRHRLGSRDELVVGVMPQTIHATKDRLYVLASAWVEHRGKRYWRGRAFFTSDGLHWHEVPPEELDQRPSLLIRNHWGNGRLLPVPGGRLMAACRGRDGLCAPTTGDPTALSGWAGGRLDVSGCPVRVDPRLWRGADGVLHYATSHLDRLWHAYSSDGGKTWSKLVRQPGFPDNRGGAAFGSMPDGSVWYVGNPLPDAQRCPLVLAVSRDGWHFPDAYLLRWEPFFRRYDAPFKGVRPGYEYPSAVCHDGKLYVVYSNVRERIELSIAALPPQGLR